MGGNPLAVPSFHVVKAQDPVPAFVEGRGRLFPKGISVAELRKDSTRDKARRGYLGFYLIILCGIIVHRVGIIHSARGRRHRLMRKSNPKSRRLSSTRRAPSGRAPLHGTNGSERKAGPCRFSRPQGYYGKVRLMLYQGGTGQEREQMALVQSVDLEISLCAWNRLRTVETLIINTTQCFM